MNRISGLIIPRSVCYQPYYTRVGVGDIHVEGTVPQNFILPLSLKKTGNIFNYLFTIFLVDFILKKMNQDQYHNSETVPSMAMLGNAKFQVWDLHNNRDMHVQKIKVQK